VNDLPEDRYLMVDGIAYMKKAAHVYKVDLMEVFPNMTEFLNHRNT
jgi:hypothetical protein